MTNQNNNPNRMARIGGVLYLMIIIIGIFGEAFVRGQLIVAGDAAATANNIQESLSLWRVSIASELILILCATAVAFVFYKLLKPVNKNLALLALLFNVVAIAIESINRLNLFAVLILLGDGIYTEIFALDQLHGLVYFALDAYTYGFGMSLVFFGLEILIIGYLIFKSVYLPKFLGVLMAIAGVCYLTLIFSMVLAPSVAAKLSPSILLPVFIGELSFSLWLIVKGVNVAEWHKKQDNLGNTSQAANHPDWHERGVTTTRGGI